MTRGAVQVAKVDDERIAVLRRDHSIAETAALVGCTERTVLRSLDRSRRAGLYGVPPVEEQPEPWTEEEDRRALAMLEDGCPYSEVTRTLGRGEKGTHLRRKFPGYGTGPTESLAIARMMRDFERLLERRGLSDMSGRNR